MEIKVSHRPALPCLALVFLLMNGCQQKGGQPAPQQPRLTLANFEQIQEGMTMEDVGDILGQPQAGVRATSENNTIKLVGVEVTELAQWTEGSSEDRRQLEVGFSEGKVAAAIYRAGDVTGIKPEVTGGRFRVIAGRHSLHSPTTMQVVVDIGAPESSLVHFGIGKSVDEIEGLEPITPPSRIELAISAKLLEEPEREGKSLEVTLKRHSPKATFTHRFSIDDDRDLSDVIALAHHSDLHEIGESIILGHISGQEDVKYTIMLQVQEKANQ